MDVGDWISLASAIVAFISMGVSVVFSIKSSNASARSNLNAIEANRIAIGQGETALREQILNTRGRSEEAALRISDFLAGRKRQDLAEHEISHLDHLENSWRSCIEGLLNAYEDACGKYLDSKTDKDRFRKAYINEIKNICDPKRESYARLMHPDSTSNYQAIWKVYREWHQYE